VHDPDMPCRTQCARQPGLPTCPDPRHTREEQILHACTPAATAQLATAPGKRFVAGRELLTSWAGERVEYYAAAGMQQRRQSGLIRLQPEGSAVVHPEPPSESEMLVARLFRVRP
jgi:hypothetical protein